MVSIEFLKFGDIEIAKQKPHSSRNLVTTDDMGIKKNTDIWQVCLWKKGFKYFFGYKNTKN